MHGRGPPPVTRSLHFRAQSETHLKQSYDQSVMIEWSPRHLLSSGEMDTTMSYLGLAVRARVVRSTLVLACVAHIGPVASLHAQQPTPPATARTGRIVGRIIDASTGQGLSDAGVQIVGTTLGTSSAIEGRYTVPNVPAGTVTIQVRRLGYTPSRTSPCRRPP